MSNRIAIVVLACATPPYDQLVDAIRSTWGSQPVPGLDIYYLYGNPYDDRAHRVLSRYVGGHVPAVEDDAVCQIQDVLIVGCADHLRQQEDCLLRKRLIAFDYLAATDRYDLIYSVCAASYVDQERLARYADGLIPRRLVAGAIGLAAASRTPFVSGASMILSVDIARELGHHRQEIIAGNAFGFRDDVTVGWWIVTRVSRVALHTFIDDIERRRPMTPDHIFVPCPQGTVNYVMTPAQEHRPVPDAFHYHFASPRAFDMVRFHQRYFGGWDNAPIDAPRTVARRPAAAMNSYRPEMRDELVIGQVDDDFLVYDPVSDHATLLNWSAAAVLDLCDGKRTVAQIIAEVTRAVHAPAVNIGAEIEEAIRSLTANGLFAPHRRIVREDNGRPGNLDGSNADRQDVTVTAPGLAPLRVPQLGDIGVGPPDTVTTVQVLGPYNSGTCLMFNYAHRLTAARTRYHILCWKHSLPPAHAWADGCLWDQVDGGPPEALLRTTLVVCMVRSPYFWLLSTARQNYDIRFEGGAQTFSERLRCPLHFGRRRYDNLTAVWNAYYRAYRTYLEPAGAAFVRLEDLVEAPMAIVNALGHHLEILSSPRLEAEVARIAATPAKVHQGPCVAGEQARQRYRVDNVPRLIAADDLALINEQIDRQLLAAFGYPIVHPAPSEPEEVPCAG